MRDSMSWSSRKGNAPDFIFVGIIKHVQLIGAPGFLFFLPVIDDRGASFQVGVCVHAEPARGRGRRPLRPTPSLLRGSQGSYNTCVVDTHGWPTGAEADHFHNPLATLRLPSLRDTGQKDISTVQDTIRPSRLAEILHLCVFICRNPLLNSPARWGLLFAMQM